jgi:hypothetical protein
MNPAIQLGVLDDQLKVCNAQAIPVDGSADVSASSIDLLMTTPKFGAGAAMVMKVFVSTAFGKSAGSPSLTIAPIVDTVSALSSASPLCAGITVKDGEGTLGAVYDIPIPAGSVNALTRFLGVSLTPSSTQFTAGNVSVWLTTQGG